MNSFLHHPDADVIHAHDILKLEGEIGFPFRLLPIERRLSAGQCVPKSERRRRRWIVGEGIAQNASHARRVRWREGIRSGVVRR